MKLGIDIKATLSQTLTPQQIQYLKLLQLPLVQLEQQIRQEIELNPMLEDGEDFDLYEADEPIRDTPVSEDKVEYEYDDVTREEIMDKAYIESNDEAASLYLDDKADPFEFHKMLWEGGDEPSTSGKNSHSDEDEFEPFQIKDSISLLEELTQQVRLLPLSKEEILLGEIIIGNVDSDGYLRRDLSEIVIECNEEIEQINKNNRSKYFSNEEDNMAIGFTNGRSQEAIKYEAKAQAEEEVTIEQHSSNILNNDSPQNGILANGNGIAKRSAREPLSNADLLAEVMARIQAQQAAALQAQQADEASKNAIKNKEDKDNKVNPALKFALSDEATSLLGKVYKSNPDLFDRVDPKIVEKIRNASEEPETNLIPLEEVSLEMAEKVRRIIMKLDPPGIGALSIQECLLAQLYNKQKLYAAERLAVEILEQCYEAFTRKHYHIITKELEVSDEYLREALEVIRSLNPRPGGGDFQAEINTVIPDFVVERDDETRELTITVNDSRMPALKLSKAYENMKKEAKYKLYNKETREWIRTKFEDAKFLIQAIRQRKNTMMKVMTAIAGRQKEFFFAGPSGLKPLIYKDISEDTGLDISTVCRIVNGKYVQSPFGTFELKFFFSESLPTDEGEEVSTRVIKQILRDIIDEENKRKPFSDDKLSKLMKNQGYNVARRTVAKYREQLKIPVARLRVEL